MWTEAASQTYTTAYKWYVKKRPRELAGVNKNLKAYLSALRAGSMPLQIKFGFIHPEGKGVVALDQGGGKGLAETRLYVFPDTANRVLWLRTIGDKKSQSTDIQLCHEMVSELLKAEEHTHEPETDESGAPQAREEGQVQQHGSDDPRPDGG